MLEFIIGALPLVKDHKQKTEFIKIAKGKYKLPETFKEAVNTIKNR
jgi:hypothetical protein